MRTLQLFIAFFVLSGFACYSQPDSAKGPLSDLSVNLRLQLRSEMDGRDFSNATYPKQFTTLRTSLLIGKSLTKNVNLFVQVNDSRLFGEENNPTYANFQNTYLHQGYVNWNEPFGLPVYLQAGRMELLYGTARFITVSSWGYVQKSYDGFRVGYKSNEFSIDGFSMTQVNSSSAPSGALPDTLLYPYPALPFGGYQLVGLYATINKFPGNKTEVFGYYEYNDKKSKIGEPTAERFTAGLSYYLNMGRMGATFEAAYQGGYGGVAADNKSTRKIVAYTIAGTLRMKLDPVTTSLNVDILSGTKEKELAEGGEWNTYDNSFQSKHTFYGYMDYFTNATVSPFTAGINDYFLRMEYKAEGVPTSAQVDAHYFQSNQPVTISEGTTSTNYGAEIDAIVRYNITKGFTGELGGSAFFADDIMKKAWTKPGLPSPKDFGWWSYFMLRLDI